MVLSAPAATRPAFRCTVFRNAEGALTKSATLTPHGALELRASAQLTRGTFRVHSLDSLDGLAALLSGLGKNEALCWGAPRDGRQSGPVATEDAVRRGAAPRALTRTLRDLGWPDGAGVLMLDFDTHGADPLLAELPNPLTVDALREVLVGAVPEVEGAPMLAWPSAGACIYRTGDGECLRGLTGLRVYVLVERAADIPAIGALIHQRLLLAGYGFAFISGAGVTTIRSLIDTSVWSPERLDFIAGAACGTGLEQRRGDIRRWNVDAAPLAPEALPPLTEAERERLAVRTEAILSGARVEAARVHAGWLAARTAAGLTAAVRLTETARDTGGRFPHVAVLGGEHAFTMSDGRSVTGAEILASPATFHKTRCADPLEPEYRGDRRIALIHADGHDGAVWIRSHAHGGCSYLLRPSAQDEFSVLAPAPDDGEWLTEDAPLPALASEGERLAALTGDAERVFLGELAASVRGVMTDAERSALVTRLETLECAAGACDPLWPIYSSEVLPAAANCGVAADDERRFGAFLRARIARNGQPHVHAHAPARFAALRDDEQRLLVRAAYMQRADLYRLTEGVRDAFPALVPHQPRPSGDDVLAQVLGRGGLMYMVGHTGGGKTWHAIEFSAAVARPPESDGLGLATPELYLGRAVQHGSVFYLAQEDPEGVGERIALRGETLEHLYVRSAAPDLTSPTAVIRFLIRATAELPPDAPPPRLLVIDTMNAAFPGEENSNTEVGTALRGLILAARVFGLAVVLLHHPPKTSEGRSATDALRGASAAPAAADVVLWCERDATGTGGAATYAVRPLKQKRAELPLGGSYGLEHGRLVRIADPARAEEKLKDTEKRVRLVARAMREISITDKSATFADLWLLCRDLDPSLFPPKKRGLMNDARRKATARGWVVASGDGWKLGPNSPDTEGPVTDPGGELPDAA
jgi:hypothetical protein